MLRARFLPLLPVVAALLIAGAAATAALRSSAPARSWLAAPVAVVALLHVGAGRGRRL